MRGIAANKLRSALTVLGILIGVGAVIVLVAVGNGSSVAIQQRIDRLGTNTLTVFDRQSAGRQRVGQPTTSIKITDEDVAALNDKTQAPDLAAASPVQTVTSPTATFDGATATIGQMIGSDA